MNTCMHTNVPGWWEACGASEVMGCQGCSCKNRRRISYEGSGVDEGAGQVWGIPIAPQGRVVLSHLMICRS